MAAPGLSTLLAACFASLVGVKEKTHRQVRFRRWVGNLS